MYVTYMYEHICQLTNSDLPYLLKFIMDPVRKIHTALKNHYALGCHKYDICMLFKSKFLQKEAI